MRRLPTMATAMTAALVLLVGLAPAATAADPVASWGSGGTVTIPATMVGVVTATAVDENGRLAVVGRTGTDAAGVVVSADGSTITPLVVPSLSAGTDSYEAVDFRSGRIVAAAAVETGLGTQTEVDWFRPDGVHVQRSAPIGIDEDTEPVSVVRAGDGRVYVGGTLGGEDDGSVAAYLASLRTDGTRRWTRAVHRTTTGEQPLALVGATDGSPVATTVTRTSTSWRVRHYSIAGNRPVLRADGAGSGGFAAADTSSSTGTAVSAVVADVAGNDGTAVVSRLLASGATSSTRTAELDGPVSTAEAALLRRGRPLVAWEVVETIGVRDVVSGGLRHVVSSASLVDLQVTPVDGSMFLTVLPLLSDDTVVHRLVGDRSGRFIDDDSSVHEANIEENARRRWTRGCNPPINDEFCPRDDVSRGQIAAFFVRALALPPTSTDYFVDDDGSVFEDDINALAAAGITGGCNPPANDRFCPRDDLKRAQLATMIVRAEGLPTGGTRDYFVDDDGSVHEANINAIAAAGIARGCNPPTNDRFCPGDPTSRSQTATLLLNAFA